MSAPDPRIGYFIVREEEGTSELEVIDTDIFDDRESAERWIRMAGIEGVDYWICAPVSSGPRRRHA